MLRPIIVIDNDIDLVTELKLAHAKNFPNQQIVGPPELCLDLPGVRENIEGAGVIILDLNIGGSRTYSQTLLKKLRRELERSDLPVIVWSKYLSETVIFEPAGVYRLAPAAPMRSASQAIEEKNLESLRDYQEIIGPLRKIYGGTRAFVSKACPDPVGLLLDAFSRTGVVSREP